MWSHWTPAFAVWRPISFVTLTAVLCVRTKSMLFRYSRLGGWLAIRLPQLIVGIISTSPLTKNGDPVFLIISASHESGGTMPAFGNSSGKSQSPTLHRLVFALFTRGLSWLS